MNITLNYNQPLSTKRFKTKFIDGVIAVSTVVYQDKGYEEKLINPFRHWT